MAGREICEVRRIIDPNGREIASIQGKVTDGPLWPRVTVSSSVHDAGRNVAVIEFVWSTKPILLGFGRLALFSSLLGVAAYAAIRRFPLRALEEAWRRMAYMASHDLLTELPDRHALRDHLVQVLASADRRGDRVGVLCLDLDRFKNVNDTLGHAVGDQLLIAVAERLNQQIRSGDVLARLGSDEFAIIQKSANQQPEGSLALAERLIECLTPPPFEIDGRQVSIGVSIGIALAQWESVSSAGELMVNADLALYKAKESGRSTYCFFEPSMNDQVQRRKTLETELETALADGQFEVHYQPQLDLVSNAVVGVEALLRWQHPEHGLLLPGEYIPVAEDSGLIVPIGEWVVRKACEDIAPYDGLAVAVNLSPAQFRDGDLVGRVKAVLAETGLQPERLELEITERVLMADDDETLQALQHLHELGVRFAMDDFGTGYASLSYLGKFPFSKIKIDRSFIGDIEDREEAFAIVRASVSLSRSLGIRATAEGLETMGQLSILRREECHEVQGFLISRPLGKADLDQFLQHDFCPFHCPLLSPEALVPRPPLRLVDRVVPASLVSS